MVAALPKGWAGEEPVRPATYGDREEETGVVPDPSTRKGRRRRCPAEKPPWYVAGACPARYVQGGFLMRSTRAPLQQLPQFFLAQLPGKDTAVIPGAAGRTLHAGHAHLQALYPVLA